MPVHRAQHKLDVTISRAPARLLFSHPPHMAPPQRQGTLASLDAPPGGLASRAGVSLATPSSVCEKTDGQACSNSPKEKDASMPSPRKGKAPIMSTPPREGEDFITSIPLRKEADSLASSPRTEWADAASEEEDAVMTDDKLPQAERIVPVHNKPGLFDLIQAYTDERERKEARDRQSKSCDERNSTEMAEVAEKTLVVGNQDPLGHYVACDLDSMCDAYKVFGETENGDVILHWHDHNNVAQRIPPAPPRPRVRETKVHGPDESPEWVAWVQAGKPKCNVCSRKHPPPHIEEKTGKYSKKAGKTAVVTQVDASKHAPKAGSSQKRSADKMDADVQKTSKRKSTILCLECGCRHGPDGCGVPKCRVRPSCGQRHHGNVQCDVAAVNLRAKLQEAGVAVSGLPPVTTWVEKPAPPAVWNRNPAQQRAPLPTAPLVSQQQSPEAIAQAQARALALLPTMCRTEGAALALDWLVNNNAFDAILGIAPGRPQPSLASPPPRPSDQGPRPGRNGQGQQKRQKQGEAEEPTPAEAVASSSKAARR